MGIPCIANAPAPGCRRAGLGYPRGAGPGEPINHSLPESLGMGTVHFLSLAPLLVLHSGTLRGKSLPFWVQEHFSRRLLLGVTVRRPRESQHELFLGWGWGESTLC